MRLWLMEDDAARKRWSPFRELRPVGDMLFGTRSLSGRIENATGLSVRGLVRITGAGVPDARSLITTGDGDDDPPSGGEPHLVLSTRFVPDGPLTADLLAIVTVPPWPTIRLVTESGESVGWIIPPGPPPPRDRADEVPTLTVRGRLLASPWSLMAENADQITRDLKDAPPHGATTFAPPSGVRILGSWPVTVSPGVHVDPEVVLDARKGPIHLGRDVEIRSFTRLEGPAWIGAGTHLLGGTFSALSTGPVCRLRGEISSSIIHGWCNKAHDGYLGHAVLGRWVNLGAFTTNSDLKNTYGPVRAPVAADRTEDTGMLKAGVLLGDHVKTGIGTLLNTGSVVGAGSNLFGGGKLPPTWVPPFSWVVGGAVEPYRLDRFFDVAQRAMARRGETMTTQERSALEVLWNATHAGGAHA